MRRRTSRSSGTKQQAPQPNTKLQHHRNSSNSPQNTQLLFTQPTRHKLATLPPQIITTRSTPLHTSPQLPTTHSTPQHDNSLPLNATTCHVALKNKNLLKIIQLTPTHHNLPTLTTIPRHNFPLLATHKSFQLTTRLTSADLSPPHPPTIILQLSQPELLTHTPHNFSPQVTTHNSKKAKECVPYQHLSFS